MFWCYAFIFVMEVERSRIMTRKITFLVCTVDYAYLFDIHSYSFEIYITIFILPFSNFYKDSLL